MLHCCYPRGLTDACTGCHGQCARARGARCVRVGARSQAGWCVVHMPNFGTLVRGQQGASPLSGRPRPACACEAVPGLCFWMSRGRHKLGGAGGPRGKQRSHCLAQLLSSLFLSPLFPAGTPGAPSFLPRIASSVRSGQLVQCHGDTSGNRPTLRCLDGASPPPPPLPNMRAVGLLRRQGSDTDWPFIGMCQGTHVRGCARAWMKERKEERRNE